MCVLSLHIQNSIWSLYLLLHVPIHPVQGSTLPEPYQGQRLPLVVAMWQPRSWRVAMLTPVKVAGTLPAVTPIKTTKTTERGNLGNENFRLFKVRKCCSWIQRITMSQFQKSGCLGVQGFRYIGTQGCKNLWILGLRVEKNGVEGIRKDILVFTTPGFKNLRWVWGEYSEIKILGIMGFITQRLMNLGIHDFRNQFCSKAVWKIRWKSVSLRFQKLRSQNTFWLLRI